MTNVTLLNNEVVLYSGVASSNIYKGNLNITLTSNQIIIEKENGFFKKELELIDVIPLEDIKTYNNAPQIKQKGNLVEVQSKIINITLSFSGIIEARKFTRSAIDAATGTTLAKRGSDKTKNALDMIDDTFGVDSRGAIKSVLEQGVKGTLINGIKTTRKDK